MYLQVEIRMIFIVLLSLSLAKAYQDFHLNYGTYNPHIFEVDSLTITDNEYIYAVGCASGPTGLLVYKFRRGIHIWNQLYPYNHYVGPQGITADSDDGFLTAASYELKDNKNNYNTLFVRKFNKDNSDAVWEYKQDENLGYIKPLRMKVLSNGNYAIVGWSSTGASITVISSTPSTIWRYDTYNDYRNGFSGLEETNDGSIIVVTGRRDW